MPRDPGGDGRSEVELGPAASSLAIGPEATWILDLDGVVWLAGEPIGPVDRAVERLRSAGTEVLFVTNNSEPTRDALVRRLERIGIGVDAEEFVTSAQAVASLVLPGERIVLLGSGGVAEAVAERNATVLEEEEPADAVVVGWCPDATDADVDRAARAITEGARFLATNMDLRHPTPQGLVPGTGALVERVAERSGERPTVAGKPNSAMVRLVAGKVAPGRRIVVVGDQVATDGRLAAELAATFVLVDSGVTAGGSGVEGEGVDVRAPSLVDVVDAVCPPTGPGREQVLADS